VFARVDVKVTYVSGSIVLSLNDWGSVGGGIEYLRFLEGDASVGVVSCSLNCDCFEWPESRR